MTQYNAEISAGSLLTLESRRVATLLLSNPDPVAWQHAIEVENILQKKTPATARRQARLLQRRLGTLDAIAWKMIAERESEVAIQLLLAAAVKHSQLLGDFMLRVYADRQRRLEPVARQADQIAAQVVAAVRGGAGLEDLQRFGGQDGHGAPEIVAALPLRNRAGVNYCFSCAFFRSLSRSLRL